MASIFKPRVFGLSLTLAGVLLSAHAEEKSKCDKISHDVRESVTKDPSKVLMIVEDALVINESCACEIVKAAITASKADKPMVKQIVQTAVAVAPKMAPVIIDCANTLSPGAVITEDAPPTVARTMGGKESKNVNPEPVVPPKDQESDFSGSATGVRGVYLMAPAAGGLITVSDHVRKPPPTEINRRHRPVPMSPSTADCNCP
jgi:hypothetical protein